MFFHTKTFIKVYCEFEGFHCWPKAPKEISYLRSLHRHLFGVVVQMQVFKNDRDVEFYVFKSWLQKQLSTLPYKKSSLSCEDFCDRIYLLVNKQYPCRDLIIEVNEDWKEGAVKHYANKAG